MSDLLQVTGLWEGVDKNDNMTLSGNLGNLRLSIFKNTYKEEEKQPDYLLYVSKQEKKKQ